MNIFNEDDLIRLNQSGYDRISHDFKVSRAAFWSELNHSRSLVKSGDKVLDLGCGYGRLIKMFEGLTIDYHGLDHSAKLITLARARYPSSRFSQGDVRTLPYDNELFDSVWMIALLHHLPVSASRKAPAEAARVIKPNGRMIITVWQPDPAWGKSWCRLGPNSFLKKWGGQSWLYYYHFRPEELKKMVSRSRLIVLEEGFLRKGKRSNYFIVAKRAPIA